MQGLTLARVATLTLFLQWSGLHLHCLASSPLGGARLDNCSWSSAFRQLLLTFWSLAQLHTGPYHLDFESVVICSLPDLYTKRCGSPPVCLEHYDLDLPHSLSPTRGMSESVARAQPRTLASTLQRTQRNSWASRALVGFLIGNWNFLCLLQGATLALSRIECNLWSWLVLLCRLQQAE